MSDPHTCHASRVLALLAQREALVRYRGGRDSGVSVIDWIASLSGDDRDALIDFEEDVAARVGQLHEDACSTVSRHPRTGSRA